MRSLLTGLTGAALSGLAMAATGTDWASRSIYQVMTDRFALTNGSTTVPCDTGIQDYCGGTWQGITNKLDYIQDMGFDAVWISPITYQLQGLTQDGSGYHGYWQQDLYRLNENFGTEQDLINLASALHDRGMVRRHCFRSQVVSRTHVKPNFWALVSHDRYRDEPFRVEWRTFHYRLQSIQSFQQPELFPPILSD